MTTDNKEMLLLTEEHQKNDVVVFSVWPKMQKKRKYQYFWKILTKPSFPKLFLLFLQPFPKWI